MSSLTILTLSRAWAPYGTDLYWFFDRAILHLLSVDPLKYCSRPSTTESLYVQAQEAYR